MDHSGSSDAVGPATLTAIDIEVQQDHQPLLPRTTLAVTPGDVTVAVGEADAAHEALALALAGRLHLDSGSIRLGDDTSPALRRARVALVDVPDVSAPDPRIPFSTIVSEELAMSGHRYGFRALKEWLAEHDLTDQRRLPWGQIDPFVALRTLAEMAAAREGVCQLILVRPERHGIPSARWMELAHELTGDGERGVLVTVSRAVATAAEAPVVIGGVQDPKDPDDEPLPTSKIEVNSQPGGAHAGRTPVERRESAGTTPSEHPDGKAAGHHGEHVAEHRKPVPATADTTSNSTTTDSKADEKARDEKAPDAEPDQDSDEAAEPPRKSRRWLRRRKPADADRPATEADADADADEHDDTTGKDQA